MTVIERAARRIPSSVALVGAVIALVPWFPYPGRTVADTKVDLVVDPWGYLARSQSAWDSHAFFGQLQNQAYGYLFPMGPFFGVGRSLHVPEWVVQRAWWTLVLVTAFVGTYLLCRRLGIAGRRGALVAAVAFALSPHALTVLGAISIEQWPSAMTPWLVLASLRLLETSGRDRRQAVALLALACAAVGGVNATATLAAIAVAAVFVLTAGSRGLRAFPLWCLGVVAGTAWWAVPLVVLGAYAYPFLDFIETSNITTSITSVPNILRGASHWVAYVGAEWPAGTELARTRSALLATAVVAVIGIIGLALRRAWPPGSHARTFAIVSLLTGVTSMGVAYGATLDLPFTSPLAASAREALDGSLSPFRNVHKFDAMVRLPICLGLAAVVGLAGRTSVSSLSGARLVNVGARLAAVVALIVAIAPAAGPDLGPRGPFDAIPDRWHAAAETIDRLAASQGGATLVAPASRFGEFTWGNVQEDPLEMLADSPVVQRDAIPLGNPGAIRVMDALDGVLQRGGAHPGLVDVLARMGIGRVVVPHDALQNLSDATDPGVLGADKRTESTLRASGLTLVRTWGTGQRRLSVWSTDRPVPAGDAYDADSVVGVTGGPEAIVSLAAVGGLGDGAPAYVTAPTTDTLQPSRWVQTDTLRRRDLNVAATIAGQYTATLQPKESTTRPDFPPAGVAAETTRGYVGLQRASASSTHVLTAPSSGVAAALDNDYETAWSSEPSDERPTIDLTLARPSRVGAVVVRLDARVGAGAVRRVEVVADGRVAGRTVDDQHAELTFPVADSVRTITVRLEPAEVEPRAAVGVADIALRDVDVAAVLDVPDVPAADEGSVVIARDPWSTDHPANRRDDGRVLARRFSVGAATAVTDVLVRARTTPAVERLVDGWTISGPRLEDLLRTRPGAALDGDPATRWTVGYLAADPTLSVELPSRRTITGLKGLGRGNRYTRIDAAVIEDLDSGQVRRWSSDTSFAPLTARRLRITFDLPRQVSYPFRMPDVTLVGAGTPPARNTAEIVDVPCADGVAVAVGASIGVYTARPTRAQLLDGSRVDATVCGGGVPQADAGSVVLRATSSDVLDAEVVRLGDPTGDVAGAPDPSVRSWTDRRREMAIASTETAQVVAWHEGFNAGWEATLDGRPLDAVTIDGWRQAFVVPAGAGGVLTATFAPDTTYRAGLLGGGILVVLMAALALVWRPRGRDVSRNPVATRVPPWVGRVSAVALPGVLGGLGGLVLGACAAVTPARWRIRAMIGTSVLLVIATVTWPVAKEGSLVTVIPQAGGLLLVALLASSLGAANGPRQGRSFDQSPGQVGDDQRAAEAENRDDHE